MVFVRIVTAVTDIGVLDMLRLLVSCLTGIGVLALGTVVVVVAYVVVTIRRMKRPERTEPLDVDWDAILKEMQK